MIALLDADIVAFRCAATAEDNDEWIAVARTNELVEQILSDTKADMYKLFLTGPWNFRYEIYPQYKANRTRPKPKHLEACRQFLIKQWGAVVCEGHEADDALGMEQSITVNDDEDGCAFQGLIPITYNSIICSIDKDLKQVPGRHYNFVKKEFDEVSPIQGLRSFYMSLLVGDPADNIRGVPGIGKVKAGRLLEGAMSEEELFNTCRATYNDDAFMELNGKLLWIWRTENDIWQFNKIKNMLPDQEVALESMQPTEGETTLFTELGITK